MVFEDQSQATKLSGAGSSNMVSIEVSISRGLICNKHFSLYSTTNLHVHAHNWISAGDQGCLVLNFGSQSMKKLGNIGNIATLTGWVVHSPSQVTSTTPITPPLCTNIFVTLRLSSGHMLSLGGERPKILWELSVLPKNTRQITFRPLLLQSACSFPLLWVQTICFKMKFWPHNLVFIYYQGHHPGM